MKLLPQESEIIFKNLRQANDLVELSTSIDGTPSWIAESGPLVCLLLLHKIAVGGRSFRQAVSDIKKMSTF